MIKFLHCADLHLDSPLTALDIKTAEVRRNELRGAFTSLTMTARMSKVDFLLIAGDLFDSAYATKETIALLCREFAALPDCKVIIAPGNHDPYTFQSYYRRTEFPDNVYIFDSPDLSCFDFPELNTTVYGYAFTSDTLEDCPLEAFRVENPDRINLLVAHGDLDAAVSKYAPIPSDTLSACGFDYAALGHIHTFSGLRTLDKGYCAYSGCLEGRGFDELGPKGAILGAADKTDGQLQLGAKFNRFSKRRYEIETLDITGAATNADVIDRIQAMIADKHYGDDTALRVRLTGSVVSDLRIAPDFLASQFPGIFLLETVDATLPLYDCAHLQEDPTIRGAFYRSLAELLDSGDESEREKAALALRYGLAALSGSDIIDF
ncbi:MAG: DNA repair exonuclease [Clostridia bacterium]|nr:DNA repair exonuclease [Clostridia bacterium]